MALAPLLAGTAERPYTLILAAVGAVLGAYAAISVGVGGVGREAEADSGRGPALMASWFAVGLLVCLVVTLLQLVPLPPSLRVVLSPGSDATLRQLIAGPARAFCLSADPAATANEAVRTAGYLALLLFLGHAVRSLGTPSRPGQSRRLGVAIYATAGLVAGLGGLAALGVQLPAPLAGQAAKDGTTRALLPAALYNSNHLAALLGIGATLAVAALRETKSLARRALLSLLSVLLNVALIGTLSRSGVVIWLLAQLVVAALPVGRDGARGLRPRALLTAGLGPLLAIGLALVLPGMLVGLSSRFQTLGRHELLAGAGKLAAWQSALPLLRGHFLLGVGRGAFETTFQAVSPLPATVRFVYLENELLQLFVDFGVPVAIGLLVLLGLGLREARAQVARRGLVRRAALVAFVALLIHNLLDFSLEVGGVAIPALGLLSLIERPRFRVPAWLAAAFSALVLIAACFVHRQMPTHDEDGQELRTLCERPEIAKSQLVAFAEAALRRHPLDSYLSSLTAARLLSDGDPEAIDWVNRALVQNPQDLLALATGAELLVRAKHRAQGLRLLGSALELVDAGQRPWLLRRAAALLERPADLAYCVSAATVRAGTATELLDVLGQEAEPRWPLLQALAEQVAVVDRERARHYLARAALAVADVDAIERYGNELCDAGSEPLLLSDLIAALSSHGRAPAAETLSRRALAKGLRPELLLSLALVREQQGDLAEARTLLEQAVQAATDQAQRARAHELRADLEERAGNPHRAESERRIAASLRAAP